VEGFGSAEEVGGGRAFTTLVAEPPMPVPDSALFILLTAEPSLVDRLVPLLSMT